MRWRGKSCRTDGIIEGMRAWFRGLSGPRRRFLAVVGVLVLVLAGFIGVRLNSGGSPAEAIAPSRPGTVLLVPGYGGSTESLNVLAEALRGAGRTVGIVTLPGDGTGDLLAQVDALSSAVDGALAKGAPSVDIVGYSAGGVVTRLFVARDARPVRRVVTLGAPLHGTQIAAAGAALLPGGCPLACQQLAPSSALLRNLDAQQLPGGLPWLSVWTENDQTVVPPDSARLTGAINVPVQQVCPGITVTHSDLPSNPVVDRITLAALDNPVLSAPSAGDILCG